MNNPITVKDLIEQLQKMPEYAIVLTEGCDCIGASNGIKLVGEYKLWDTEKREYVATYEKAVIINRMHTDG